MDVSSVSSSVYSAITANSQTQARNSQPEESRSAQQSQQATQAQSSQQTQKADAAQNTPPVNESDSASRAQAESENARPTVNTSGQTVGTRVNTTA